MILGVICLLTEKLVKEQASVKTDLEMAVISPLSPSLSLSMFIDQYLLLLFIVTILAVLVP